MTALIQINALAVLSDGPAGRLYECEVNGIPVKFVLDVNVIDPVDGALHAYKQALMLLHSQQVRTAVDEGSY
jgi:hypothetical protein